MKFQLSKTTLILLFFFAAAIPLLLVAGQFGGRRGLLEWPFEPIKDLNSPQVKEIVAFAISEHNKSKKDNLSLVSIVSGETYYNYGLIFDLVLMVSDNGAAPEKKYAYVYLFDSGEKELVYLESKKMG